MKNLVISRKEWLRGEGGDNSFLFRNHDSKYCCVGIYLKSCGLTDKYLCGVRTAEKLLAKINDDKNIPYWLLKEDVGLGGLPMGVDRLYTINDEPQIYEEEREKQIAEIFRNNDVNVIFVD